MVRKRLNRNLTATAIVDLPEISDELEKVKSDVNVNTQDITTIKSNIEQIESEIGNHYTKQESDEKYATITQLNEANEQISQNQQDIENTAKLNANNVFSGTNTFNNNISLLQNKVFNLGWTNSDLKMVLSCETASKNSSINNPQGNITISAQGDIILQPKSGKVINGGNRRIYNVAAPTQNSDVAIKSYVDNTINNKFVNTYNYGENETNYTINEKKVYCFRFNPDETRNLPNSGGNIVISSGVDEVINACVWVYNAFNDNTKWRLLPAFKRSDASNVINLELYDDGSLRLLNWSITGDRKFKGYVFYTKGN